VVDEAGTASEAVRNALRSQPDVIVMDVRLGDGSGIEATREIRAELPETHILMLTSFNDDEALFSAMMAGAAGYLLKQIRGDEIVSAIRKVGSGISLMDPARTQTVLARLRRGKHMSGDERLGRLSAQEEKVVLLVADGCTNREIGDRLDLAEKTVKNYVSSVLRKLEVGRRAEAAAYLVRHTQPEA
jgi:two-component system, NarL family, response regulator DevR